MWGASQPQREIRGARAARRPAARAAAGGAAAAGGLLAVHVAARVRPGGEAAFLAASLENARNSVQEPGVARFDVVQDQEDPTRFCLVEVYRTAGAPAAHKETSHYAAWRDVVAGTMKGDRMETFWGPHFSTAFRVTSAPTPAVVGTAMKGALGRVRGRPRPTTSRNSTGSTGPDGQLERVRRPPDTRSVCPATTSTAGGRPSPPRPASSSAVCPPTRSIVKSNAPGRPKLGPVVPAGAVFPPPSPKLSLPFFSKM